MGPQVGMMSWEVGETGERVMSLEYRLERQRTKNGNENNGPPSMHWGLGLRLQALIDALAS